MESNNVVTGYAPRFAVGFPGFFNASVIMLDEGYINDWIRYLDATAEDEEPELHWIDSYLVGLMMTDRAEELWEFVMGVYRRDVSDHVLSILASGPLEELLAMCGYRYIERVEALAEEDPLFRKLLGNVWQNAMPDDLWARVCAVKGEPF